jgi:hypothetical protein
MRNPIRTLQWAILPLAVVTTLACSQKQPAEDQDSTGSGFTVSGLAKTWTGACTAGTDAITGADHYKVTLALDASTGFTWMQAWYTGGDCAGAHYTIIYNAYGTYAIGALSGGLYAMTFTVTSSDMMSMTTAAQDSVTADCGGTTPYQSPGIGGDNGAHKSTYMMACMSMNLPNSGNKTIDEVGSLSGGVLSLGAGDNGVPGVFHGNAIPGSSSLDFN